MTIEILLMLLDSTLPAGQTILYLLLTLVGGGVVNFAISLMVYRWQKRQEVPDNLSFRITRLEQAFVAHTGVTLNGKDYTKER